MALFMHLSRSDPVLTHAMLEVITDTFVRCVLTTLPHGSHLDLDASNVQHLLFRSIRIHQRIERNRLLGGN